VQDCMTGLPASIESYLVESGFSATELLILRHAIGGEALTLRELATKTGKSTGVLDQASKKLLSRRILTKEKVNGVPKYTVDSVNAITKWVQQDSKIKKELITRKEQDFQKFIESLTRDSFRPRMEYFEGRDGILKAYMQLLNSAEGEMLQFLPMTFKEEDDPLRSFKVQYFRERKKRKIFLRVIGYDSPLGRRFQSRDHFEFRETTLVPKQVCPITFEKIIMGDTIACFNHNEERACFIHYPELAQAERDFFRITSQKEGENSNTHQLQKEGSVPVCTLTLSGLRSFFLSRESIQMISVFCLIAALTTYLQYSYTLQLNTKRVREKVEAIASTVAPEFSGDELAQIQDWRDVDTELYRRIAGKLSEIRERNTGVEYVYILRPTEQIGVFSFVADADSMDLTDKTDLNHDGLINDILPPGYLWLDEKPETSAISKALEYPASDKYPVKDEWGTWISGHAPIKDSANNTVAVIGIDMRADSAKKLTQNSFMPIKYFSEVLVAILVVFIFTVRRQVIQILSFAKLSFKMTVK